MTELLEARHKLEEAYLREQELHHDDDFSRGYLAGIHRCRMILKNYSDELVTEMEKANDWTEATGGGE